MYSTLAQENTLARLVDTWLILTCVLLFIRHFQTMTEVHGNLTFHRLEGMRQAMSH